MQTKTFIHLFFTLLLLATSGRLYAGIVPVSDVISTPNGGTPAVVTGGIYANKTVTIAAGGANPHSDRLVQGVLTFAVNHQYPKIFSPSDIKIEVDIQGWTNEGGSADVFNTLTMEISDRPNDATYPDKQSMMISGVRKYKATITKVWVNGTLTTVLPANLTLKLELFVDRYYNFATATANTPIAMNAASVTDLDCDEVDDQLILSWPGVVGAEEYQLEWMYVNYYGEDALSELDPDELSYDFKRNSTRISTIHTSYALTLAFDKGYICYRVRAVGRQTTDLTKVIFGVWSSVQDAGTLDLLTTKYKNDVAYEGGKNWQYATTYAEEGKKKEVISFFDGSLRNRQMVTKVNTDNNTIVGETIYDHMGRPAVQVLPVPAEDPSCAVPNNGASLKYYQNFSQNLDGEPYSREDFDIHEEEGDPCVIYTLPMGIENGAGKYYSGDNPDQTAEQAYLPDAEGFPFSQVEYMPDNTGRVRRQSGVGGHFVLGSKHETSYYYGHPTQLELDRMFGSEVGDYLHYQKNMVVDPNGQTSISYLDQEGRVIATSLAGNVPENLEPLLDAESSVVLTENMFKTNNLGVSGMNKLSPDGKTKKFNETMLVEAESEVTITYDLDVTALTDPCLAENICLNCIYDLTINIIDECGIDRTEELGFAEKKMTGNFSFNEEDELEFSTSCAAFDFEMPISETVTLQAGSYQVIKVLTINEEALAYYVDSIFLDPEFNTCIKTLEDFEEEYLEATDFSGCDPVTDCAACLEEIGTADQFIANGLGTMDEYNTAVAACTAPCETATVSNVQLEMLLMDMSPAGQYAEYLSPDGIYMPSMFPVSILNEGNVLPKSQSGGVKSWRTPKLIDINNVEHDGYFEQDLVTRSIIVVQPIFTAGVLSGSIPEAQSLGDIQQDPVTGDYFIYPEFLAEVDLFINTYWKESWANSLLKYHPEFPMYQIYSGYTKPVTAGDAYTSASFDDLLRNTTTYSDAVTRGFISGGAVTNWFATSSSIPWDPFVVYSSGYGGYGAMLSSKFSSYSGGYSMVQIASATSRCENSLLGASGSTILSCSNFGAGSDPDLLNKEWNKLVGLYLSAKFELQSQRAIEITINDASYLGYNGCIGNPDFNPLENGFSDFSTFPLNEYINMIQPCNFAFRYHYEHKEKRFPAAADFNADYNNVAYQHYLTTGQSPIAANLQYFLNEVVALNKLTDVSFTASDLTTFPGFFLANNNNVIAAVPTTTWSRTSLSTTGLSTNLTSSGPMKTISLTSPATVTIIPATISTPAITASFSWTDITSLHGLHYTGTSGGNYLFEITATVELSGDEYQVPLTGSTTYDIGDYDYAEECHPNNLATDLSLLLDALANTNNLNSTTAVSIGSGTNYNSFSTPLIKAQASSGATSNLYFVYSSGLPGFKIYESGSSNLKLELKIVSSGAFSLANLGNIKSFSGITYTGTPGTNAFVLHGLDALGAPLADLVCTAVHYTATSIQINVPLGTCALPTPSWCNGPQYTNMDDLVNLLFNVLSTQSPATPGYNIYASPAMTPSLLAQLPVGVSNSTSTSSSVLYEGLYYDTITINIHNGCPIVITNTSEDPLAIYDMIGILSTHPYGETDESGNYHSFYVLAEFGNEAEKYIDTIFVTSCFPVDLCGEAPEVTDTEIEFPTGVFEDPCTDYLTGIAYANALNAYNDYMDDLRTYITRKYIDHCMGAAEAMTRSYTDNEYHRTLYYYDQAGNLVKTIPPEGVQLLNITSDTDPEELLIVADRNNKTHIQLTQHRMATIYEYNSLNQLVRQSMPDQDPVNVWEISLPNGLQAGLNTTAIQMVNANTGYLTGWVSQSGKVRGFLYRTDNGGANWTKINNTVASNLKKVQMVSSSIGYAVGSYGVALKTEDGGLSWDMLNTYGSSVVADLNDLYFSSATSGRFVGKNGVEVVTTDGGSTFSVSTTISPYPGHTVSAIRSVEPFGSSFMYTVTMSGSGTLYDIIAIGTSTNTWVAQTIQGAAYHAMHFYDANNGIIAGEDGNLVAAYVPTTGAAHVQTNLPSGISNKILRVYFVNATRGIALIEDGSNKALVYTIDKGVTWSPVEGAQSTYADLQLSAQTFSTSVELIAVGADARTERIVMTNNILPQIIDHTNYQTPQTLDLTSAQVVQDVAGRRIIAGTSDGKIYYSNLLLNGNEAVTYTLIGTLSSGNARKILLNYFSSTGGVSGTILTSTGHLYTIHRAGSALTYALGTTNLGPSGSVFRDISGSGTIYFAYNVSANNRLYRINLSSSAPGVATLLANAITGVGAINAIAVSQGGRVSIAGQYGEIQTTALDRSVGDPSGGWHIHGNLRMTPINEIQFISGNDALAIGDEGMLMKRVLYNAAYTFMITPLKLQNHLKAITPHGSNYLLAGSNGLVSDYTYLSNVTTPFILNNGQLTTSYFADVTFNAAGVSGDNVYVAGTNGTVLYSPNTSTNLFTFTNVQHVTFNSLSITPGQTGSFVKMYAVGTDSKIYRFSGTSGMQIKQVYSNEVYDVHFANTNVGTFIGKNYFARQTFDGGITWKVVLPSNTVYLPFQLNTVWTLPDGFAILAGNTYFSKIVNGIAYTPTGYSDIFRDIDFAANSPLEGYTATSTRMRKLSLVPLGGNDYTVTVSGFYPGTGVNIHAVHAFENGGVMIAGASGYIGYMKPGATTSTAWLPVSLSGMSSVTYKDIFFHDDATGYLVGTDGTKGIILRTNGINYSTTSSYPREITSVKWLQKSYVESTLVTPTTNISPIVTTESSVSSINAIAFSTKTQGIWGGSYASGFTSINNTAYVRKINDESSEFSSQFFYDKLGRLVVSQNSRQYAATPKKYSYSLYDALGRVYEAGEKTENSTTFFAGIFGTIVNDLFNPAVIDDAKLNYWINANGARTEVTRSYYDATVITGLPAGFTPTVSTQRKRITHVTYEAVYDGNDQTFDHATHYDYDIHGNVKTLLQDNKKMADLDVNLSTQRFKRLDYVYDLVSGNVHRVSYQTGKADQWHHAYTYDADNRITETRTSQTTPFIDPIYGIPVMMNETFGPYWDKEAGYAYYDHGPLARTELGVNKVQGIDYTYTLQGWMKGVNATGLDAAKDPGKDGLNPLSAAKDAYSFGLEYHSNDYYPIGGQVPFGNQNSSDLAANSKNLFNGNIARMVTTITNPTTREVLPLGNAYRYDQLNRIKESRSFATFNPTTYNWNTATTYNDMYYNAFTYDRNGNILTQQRMDEAGTGIDNLSYNYEMRDLHKVNNRLYSVDDAVTSGSFPDDIDDMDGIVGMDENTGSREIVYDQGSEWTSAPSGVTVNFNSTTGPKVGSKCATFDNLVDGGYVGFQRSSAISVSGYNYLTFFIRNRKAVDPANNMRLFVLLGTTGYNTMLLTNYGYNRGMVGEWQTISIPLSAIGITGNVDKIRIRSSVGVTDTYNFDIDQMMFTTDPLPSIVPNSNYAYDEEGRLIKDMQEGIAKIDWRVDGKVLKITRPGGSPKKNLIFDYDAMGNRIAKHVLTSADVLEKSTYYVLDAQGNTMSVYERTVDEEEESVEFFQAEKHIYGSSRLGMLKEKIPLLGSQNSTYSMSTITHTAGLRNYELSNHLGNVLSVISDKLIAHNNGSDVPDYYMADIRHAMDYSPFGVTLSGRNFQLDENCEFIEAVVEGWTSWGTTGVVALAHEDGKLVVNSPVRYRCSQKSFTTVPGEVYSVTIDINVDGLGEDVYVLMDDNSSPASFSSSGVHTFTFTATQTLTTMRICFGNEGGGVTGDYSYEINSFSVEGGVRVSDCPQVDVMNDDFESTAGSWIERGYPVSFGLESGKLKVEASSLGQGAKKTVTTVIGEEYTFEFTLSGVDLNQRVEMLIYDAVASTYYNDYYVQFVNGTYKVTFTAASTSTRIEFYHQEFVSWVGNRTFYLDNVRLYSYDESGPCSSSVLDDQVIVDDSFDGEMVCSGGTGGTGVDGEYRYGFNGMEADNEVSGEGNSYTTEFRQYDPRLGRWLSPDPLAMVMPSHTPYSFSNNNPIYGNDQDGDICIPCMVLNGLLDLGGQIIGSMAGGSSFSEALGDVSWMSVGWSVLEGASPGAAARRVGKLISNPAIKPYIDEFIGAISDLVSEYIDDGEFNLDQYLKELVYGKAVQTKTRRREHHDTRPVRRALHRQQRLNRTRPSAAARKQEKKLKKQLQKLNEKNHFKNNIGGNARKEVLKVVDLSDEKTPENVQASNETWERDGYIGLYDEGNQTVFVFQQKNSLTGQTRIIEQGVSINDNGETVFSDEKVVGSVNSKTEKYGKKVE